MDITFLKEEQIWGDKALQVMKDYGTKVGCSDLGVVLGSPLVSFSTLFDNDLSTLSWSASSCANGKIRFVGYGGFEADAPPYLRTISARPVLSSSETSKVRPREVKAYLLPNRQTVQICQFGEYPQTVADEKTFETLESLYVEKGLKTSSKKYTFDSERLDAHNDGFNPQEHPEHEFNGKRYVRVEGKMCDRENVLSNGEQVKRGKPYWIEVQPIEWLMDPTGVWVSKRSLFAGIQFDTKEHYFGDFSKTFMKSYLDTYFAKEMMANDFEKEIEVAKSILVKMPVTEIANNNEQIQNIDTEILIDAAASMEFNVQNAVLLARKDEILNSADLRSKIKKSMEEVLKKDKKNNTSTVSNYILYNKICNINA